MAWLTFEQIIERIVSGKQVVFVDKNFDVITFGFDGSYRMTVTNMYGLNKSEILTYDEFEPLFTYYLRHYKMGKSNEMLEM